MPRELKLAILALTLSGVACLLALVVDGWALCQFLSGPSFFQLLSAAWMGLNGLWLLLLIWLGWALFKRQRVDHLLLVASVVLLVNLLPDYPCCAATLPKSAATLQRTDLWRN